MQRIDPALVFVMETKLSEAAFTRVAHRLGFHYFVSLSSVGLRGGLGLLWRPNISIVVGHISPHIIYVVVHPGASMDDYAMYFVYGSTRWQDKLT